MDAEKCKALLCALECGSLVAAAERMGYTPSGISRAVASLEESVGFPLLIRSRSGVRPTRACETLLPAMGELVRWEERCGEIAAQLRGLDSGRITVASAYHAYDRWLAGLVAEFSRRWPGIQVHIMEGTSSQLAELLDRGEVDFALISRREGRFCWKRLRSDPLMVWVPRGHPAETAGRFFQADLETVPYIEMYPGQETDESLFRAQHGICPDTRYATSDVYAACAMVEAGLGVALMNGLLPPAEGSAVSMVPLDPPQFVEIGLATSAPAVSSPAAKRFAAFAEERLAGLEG